MAAKGPGASGEDQDDAIFVPYTTVQKKLLGRGATSIQNITVSATSPAAVSAVAEEIAAVLRLEHELIQGEDDDFSVRTMEEIASVRTQTAETMTGLLAAIAAVSLLVGGIGIMNITLVSVTDPRALAATLKVLARALPNLGDVNNRTSEPELSVDFDEKTTIAQAAVTVRNQ